MPPHDTLWKSLLQAFFASFLRLLAPELAPGRIVFLDKEVFPHGPKGERREADLVARIASSGGSLLVHVEVESRHDKKILHRLEQYYHLLQGRYGEPVYSILLTLQGGPKGIRQLTREESVAGQPRLFGYTSVGLSGLAAEALLASPEPIAWAFAALAPCRGMRKAARKLECLTRIAQAELQEHETYLLVNAVKTYLQLSEEQQAIFETLKLRQEDRTVQKIEMTWMDQMREEGRLRGREERREEDFSAGALHLLKHLLSQRFGELSAGTLAKVEKIRSLSRLTLLAEKTLSARSLEEMGL